MRKLRFLIFLILIFVLFLLTGCGAVVKGSIDINEDGSGSRTIIGVVKNDDISRLRGGEAALDEVLNINKPEVLKLDKVKKNDEIHYIFSYDFKNFEEYISKTEKIIKRKPDSEFLVSGGIFNRKYSFSESDISSELVKWAANAVSKSWIEVINPNDVYKVEGTSVSLVNNKLDFNSNIDITANKSYEVERIDIITVINKLSGYERNIVYSFTKYTNVELNKQKNQLYNFMLDLLPKGGKLEKVEEQDLVKYIISFSSNDLKGLNDKTREASFDSRASISLNRVGGNGITEEIQEYSDTIDFSKFLEDGVLKSGIIYKLTIPAEHTFKKLGDMDIEDRGADIQFEGNSKLVIDTNIKTLIQNFTTNQVNFNAQFKTKGEMIYVFLGVVFLIGLVTSGILITKFIMKRQEKKFNRRREESQIEKTWAFDTDWTLNVNKNEKTEDLNNK